MKQVIMLYREAYELMRKASFQGHSDHWDFEGTHGLNCPACIQAREQRKAAEEIFNRAQALVEQSGVMFDEKE